MDIVTTSAMVVGIVAVFSQVGLAGKYKPLVALIVGVGLTLLIKGIATSEIINGIIAGLTASGMWAGVKTMQATPSKVEAKEAVTTVKDYVDKDFVSEK